MHSLSLSIKKIIMTIFEKIDKKTDENFYRSWQAKLTTIPKDKKYAKLFGITVIYGYLAAGPILLFLPWTRSAAFFAFISFAFAWVILVKFISFLYPRPRPFQKYNFTPVVSGLFSKIDTTADAFPSGHLASLAAITTAFLLSFPILGIVSALFTVGVARARIILGYHFLSDVLFGVLFGIIAAFIFWPTLG